MLQDQNESWTNVAYKTVLELTLCFNIFFANKGSKRGPDNWRLDLVRPSNSSKSGSLRRCWAICDTISGRAIRSSTASSLLLIPSASFKGWQIQFLSSRFPDEVTQLSRYLYNVPETQGELILRLHTEIYNENIL